VSCGEAIIVLRYLTMLLYNMLITPVLSLSWELIATNGLSRYSCCYILHMHMYIVLSDFSGIGALLRLFYCIQSLYPHVLYGWNVCNCVYSLYNITIPVVQLTLWSHLWVFKTSHIAQPKSDHHFTGIFCTWHRVCAWDNNFQWLIETTLV